MTTPAHETRRAFLKRTAAATTLLAVADLAVLAADSPNDAHRGVPWYRRTLRWGQTNINELDPQRYDIAWWREHWKRTNIGGVIVNAGGIVAYYPSKIPLQYQARTLGDRDLYGELARAAHEDGLAVLARMDSNRVHEEFFQAHPDWIARDADGQPYRNTGLYVMCVNSPYYSEFLPSVLREIIGRSQPEGVTDNNWSGLDRDSFCYCDNCQRSFRDKSGQPIPRSKNWNDAVFRQWIQWNYERRLEIWDVNNRVTRDAGGPDCLWLGMNGASVSGQARSFRDLKAICERSEIVMLDFQSRSDAGGFQSNGEAGKLLHGLLGWDKLIPESMAMYQAGRPMFRLTSKPEPEARLWMLEGFAGGIQPWWHHLGAYEEDRRMLQTAEPILRWHKEHERYLANRQPIATVGLAWSQGNNDFFGRDNGDELVELPWRGWTNALVRARIPYLPVHLDHVARDAGKFSVLILPNLAAMSAGQVEAVRAFVKGGGSVIATGDTSRCNEWGEAQPDFTLADLFGAHATVAPAGFAGDRRRWAAGTQHTYLRLLPEIGSRADGPRTGKEPVTTGGRHPALKGFDATDLLPFGGILEPLRLDSGASVLATFVPPFPVSPPEDVWMREPRTDIPALIVNDHPGSGRVAFMPADLDRRFGRDNLPDNADVLANLVHWAARDGIPLQVGGVGFVDCHLYRQEDKLVLHLVNLTNTGAWRAAVDELIHVGPFQVRVRLPAGNRGRQVQFLVANHPAKAAVKDGWSVFEVPTILDHEVAVIG